MLNGLSLIIFSVVIAGMFWVAGFPLPYLLNNYRLNSFADQLNAVPLPPQTQKIGPLVKTFGNLGPCSKHGDYRVELKIASTLAFAQLKCFYGRCRVQVPEISNPIFFMFRGLGTHGPQAINIKKINGAENKYVVYAEDFDYWHNDFRCW
jgi:hypothetical protein